MWLYDKLFNRKIEGKSSLDNLEPLVAKVGYEGDKVKVNSDVQVEGLTSKGIANTGALANIGDVAVTGDGSFSGDVEVGSVKSINIIQLNQTAFDTTKFEVVEATCEVINNRCHLYRIVFNILEDITDSGLTLTDILPEGARPSREWVGQYLPKQASNFLAYARFRTSGSIYLYSANQLKANETAEICVLSLW